MTISSPRGTVDIFGKDIDYRNFIIDTAKELFCIYNYKEIITPTFEHTEVFSRSIGEATDIVQKEMYTFSDKKGRSLTLRPEGTASVVRAFIESKMYSGYLPVKLFYIGSMFRYERPQKGRMREFYQLGIEAIGTDNPFMDAEVIWLLNTFFIKLGFTNLTLLINSMGCIECRGNYTAEFKSYLKPRVGKLCFDCQQRYNKNPLRIFDCRKNSCRELLKNSPKIYTYLCSKCTSHLNQVLDFLKELKINYKIDHNLVRGFDYYTKTIFEVVSREIKSAQNALGGGGRYDNLIEQFGGPALPAIGFAVGIDRTLMLMKKLGIKINKRKNKTRIYIIAMDENCRLYSLQVLKYLRENNCICDINYNIKKINSELKWTEKNRFDFVIIIGENEVKSGNLTIKDLKKYEQYEINFDTQKKEILNLVQK